VAAKRLADLLLAGTALVVAAPVLAVAALGIRLSDPGPVLYRARRAGRGGRPFTMYKLRSMRLRRDGDSAITARDDPRVFRFGAWLRRTRIDELPQLVNVLRGEMSLIGPRPEDPDIVERRYTAPFLDTLSVRPGLASPGSLFNATHGEALIGGDDPERHYVEQVLPLKLALDLVYVRRASLAYDLRLMGRTAKVIVAGVLGRGLAPPPELPEARRILRDEVGARTPDAP
jgi:lipopolysaccharide/colanic/teichoic acid biosynthesis glycosyltransferase